MERAFGRLKSTAGFTQMRAPESQSAACPLWTKSRRTDESSSDACFPPDASRTLEPETRGLKPCLPWKSAASTNGVYRRIRSFGSTKP